MSSRIISKLSLARFLYIAIISFIGLISDLSHAEIYLQDNETYTFTSSMNPTAHTIFGHVTSVPTIEIPLSTPIPTNSFVAFKFTISKLFFSMYSLIQ